MHIEAEPEDLVMRAKVCDSLAECFMVVEDYAEAYRLLLQTVGPNSPLFGKQARHSANLLIAQGEHARALPFLAESLAVEATRDAVKVEDVLEVIDLIVNTYQKSAVVDQSSFKSNHSALKALRKNLSSRALDTSA